MVEKFDEKICAIVTTFVTDPLLKERIKRIESQVDLVIIIDDSGKEENFNKLIKLFNGEKKIFLHKQLKNSGIATALNKGIEIAKKEGMKWVFTLDDDTCVDDGIVRDMLNKWKIIEMNKRIKIGLMGMEYVNYDEIEKLRKTNKKYFYEEKRGLITSGSLFKVKICDEIGGFRDEFFIDYVDYDFCLRARERGYRIIKIKSTRMAHKIGDKIKKTIFGIKIESTNHKSIRRYYQFRNSTILAIEYFMKDILFSLAIFYFQIKTILLIMLIENKRKEKFSMIFKGYIDALRRRMGKYEYDKSN